MLTYNKMINGCNGADAYTKYAEKAIAMQRLLWPVCCAVTHLITKLII